MTYDQLYALGIDHKWLDTIDNHVFQVCFLTQAQVFINLHQNHFIITLHRLIHNPHSVRYRFFLNVN